MTRGTILGLVALTALAASLAGPEVARAADPKYIVVRLDEVHLLDGGDGNEGEIQYFATAATGDRESDPIAVQAISFPTENWYEGKEDGVNATFMDGHHRALPLFAFPEAEMGDELLITVAVTDDDDTSYAVVIGHAAVAKIGTAVADYFDGPASGKALTNLTSAVRDEIEKNRARDSLGILAVTFKKKAPDGSTFGLPAGKHDAAFETRAGNVRFDYSIHRVADRPAVANWCAAIKLDKIKIVDDSDDGAQGPGDIYVRARSADGFVSGAMVDGASQLHQTVYQLPSGTYTREVSTGEEFLRDDPLRGSDKGKLIYSNTRGEGRNARCTGLPIFIYVEVDVFDDDGQGDCSGRSCDDVLGVLPLLFTQAWMRDNTGNHQLAYDLEGARGRAKVTLTIDIWNPSADPDAPISH